MGVVAADGTYRLIDSGPLPEAVAASAAIPFVFAPVNVPGALLAAPRRPCFGACQVITRVGFQQWECAACLSSMLFLLVRAALRRHVIDRDLRPVLYHAGTYLCTPASSLAPCIDQKHAPRAVCQLLNGGAAQCEQRGVKAADAWKTGARTCKPSSWALVHVGFTECMPGVVTHSGVVRRPGRPGPLQGWRPGGPRGVERMAAQAGRARSARGSGERRRGRAAGADPPHRAQHLVQRRR